MPYDSSLRSEAVSLVWVQLDCCGRGVYRALVAAASGHCCCGLLAGLRSFAT